MKSVNKNVEEVRDGEKVRLVAVKMSTLPAFESQSTLPNDLEIMSILFWFNLF